MWYLWLVFVAALLWHRRHLYKLSWELRGPFAWPLLGNILSLWNEDENVKFLDEVTAHTPSPLRLWLGPQLYVVIHDAVNAEIVTKSRYCLDKPGVYDIVKDALGGDGLFSMQTDRWRFHRRLMSPTLNELSVVGHVPSFNRQFKQFALDLASQVGQQPFDVQLPLTNTGFSVFLDAILGLDYKFHGEYAEHFNKSLSLVSKRIYRPWLHIGWIWRMTNYYKESQVGFEYVHDIVEELIAKSLKNNASGDSILDSLLRLHQSDPTFTIGDVKAETGTLLAGASDTVTVTMATVLLLLAMHPEHQEKVYQEIKQFMPTRDSDLTAEHLGQLKFTRQCIMEALRLMPTVPLMGRSPTRPIKLSNGVIVPAGVPLILAVRQTQTRTEYWGHDAKQFNPDRYERPECQSASQRPGTFLGFSHGLRNCIGYHYAMATTKMVIAHTIRHYRLTTPLRLDELKMKQSITYRLLNKHLIQIHARE